MCVGVDGFHCVWFEWVLQQGLNGVEPGTHQLARECEYEQHQMGVDCDALQDV